MVEAAQLTLVGHVTNKMADASFILPIFILIQKVLFLMVKSTIYSVCDFKRSACHLVRMYKSTEAHFHRIKIKI